MKLLHTSDWHLGRTLYSKKERRAEHSAFLEWLLGAIKENNIDVLVIAGDIFDTATPSSASLKLYYEFLSQIRMTRCQNVIVIGGNHDSPSVLNAPKEILAALNISVVGDASAGIEEEIIVINDSAGKPGLIVCGVPFLRERDISRFREGENYSDRSQRINQKIKEHYEDIARLAEKKREELGGNIPIIATGHLSVAGGKRNDDDGVRETYIGTIEAVGSDIFPDTFQYVALGHYHIPSTIKHHIRYCGSPIPMGFGEAKQTKCVYVIDFDKEKNIETLKIPVFQKLESIVGNKDHIKSRLEELKTSDISVWLEISYNGDEMFPDLSAWAYQQVENSQLEILKLQNRKFLTEGLTIADTADVLDELTPDDVFEKLLSKTDISEEQKEELWESYREIITTMGMED